MHNIKEIRQNLSKFEQLISKRNIKIEIKELSTLDQQNRNLIQEKNS